MPRWDPTAYLGFSDERSRAFFDLTGRIESHDPALVVDLGCGPGPLTAALARRWPQAAVRGVDSSPEMISAAQPLATVRLRFQLADIADRAAWRPDQAVDVMVSNATLQWVPHHRDLLSSLVDLVSPDGWLAFQVPGNFGEPSHRLLHELSDDPRFAAATRGLERPQSYDASAYLSDLTRLGCDVDAWETTYLHVLTGPDPVFRWIAATGARPILEALEAVDERLRAEFVADYTALLDQAYPPQAFGTVLPFRRIFVVAHKQGR